MWWVLFALSRISDNNYHPTLFWDEHACYLVPCDNFHSSSTLFYFSYLYSFLQFICILIGLNTSFTLPCLYFLLFVILETNCCAADHCFRPSSLSELRDFCIWKRMVPSSLLFRPGFRWYTVDQVLNPAHLERRKLCFLASFCPQFMHCWWRYRPSVCIKTNKPDLKTSNLYVLGDKIPRTL